MQHQLSRPLVLGSSSIYRRQLLERLGLPFTVQSPGIDETPRLDEAPAALAARLALAKAYAVADLNGASLGKPGTHERATAQLQSMRGQTVVFQTAMAVVCRATGFESQAMAPVVVKYRELSDAEIEYYLRTEQPYDCAGSAKSEGLGIALLDSIENDDPTALVGLPLIRLSAMLRAAGLPLLGGL